MKRIGNVFSLILAVTLLLCMTACKPTYDSRIVCEKYIRAVVEIQVRDDSGAVVGNATGTVVAADGMILTNRHVIRGYDFASNDYVYYNDFYIRRYDEEEYTQAELVRYSGDSDLALLQAPLTFDAYFEIGSTELLQYGETVHTIGNGNGYGLAYAQGSVAAPLRKVVYESETVDAIQLNLTINEGNSGGPLIGENGELIGITTFRLRDKQNNVIYGTSFALPVMTIDAFLSD